MRKMIFAALLVSSPVLASEDAAPSRCMPISIPQKAASDAGGKWVSLSHEQWAFLRGVFVLNPETPAGLPIGDKAFLARSPMGDAGLVFFGDDTQACDPMKAPKKLMEYLDDVAAGKIGKEGDPL